MKKHYTIIKKISFVLAIKLLLDAILPSMALALTSGPAQPEMQGFQPIESSNLVDLFTGDFKYNIPLCEIGGYPLNINYQSGAGVEDEASWVGLGWTLNPGAINRTTRGIPDDFRGDTIKRQFSMKPDETYGVNFGVSIEAFGFFKSNPEIGFFYNNYKGWGFELGIAPSFSIGKVCGSKALSGINLGGSLSYNSQAGFGISPTLGFENNSSDSKGGEVNMSFGGFNSRQGLKELSFDVSYKKNDLKISTSEFGGGSISFGSPSFTPVPEMPLLNQSYTFNATVGGDFFGVHPNVRLRGYHIKQSLIRKKRGLPAFGYLNNEIGQKQDDALMDFQRDRNVVFHENIQNISPVVGNFDLFTLSAQNGSGQFRLHRNDVGYFGDARKNNRSNSIKVGGEVGFGAGFHVGFDANVVNARSTANKWKENNQAKDSLEFTGKFKGSPSNISMLDYEPAYFVMNDETLPIDESFYSELGENSPVWINVRRSNTSTLAERQFNKGSNLSQIDTLPLNKKFNRIKRQERNVVISFLNTIEARLYGLEKQIKSYKFNQFKTDTCNQQSLINRVFRNTEFPRHHFSEFTSINTDGTRNVFGIPVYNHVQKEVSFSVGEMASSSHIIQYDSGDDSPFNNKGLDNYFNSEETPKYATSFLLTGVLSSDYVDRTGDGITPDDLGTAIKFNYSCVERFKWRSPLGLRKARLNKGNNADPLDNKASYLYGEKDVWYIHSIESNTEVANFYTSNRNDALGVVDQNGDIDTTSAQRLKRLDSIRIYSKADLIADPVNAIPLKTICFVYEENAANQICPGIPNSVSGQGKLTLKEVYTKYFRNNIKFNHYKFTYQLSGLNGNYSYSENNSDRWGFYRDASNCPNPLYFPFTYQDSVAANNAAKAFNLKQIVLPSGGTINIDFESDDYAYVQDKRAGQMMFIKGFLTEGSSSLISKLYQPLFNPAKYIVLDLPKTVPIGEINLLKQMYFDDVENLYFNFYVDFTGNNHWNYVNGYLELDKNGIEAFETSGSSITSIKVPINIKSTSRGFPINALSKAVFQKLRLELNSLIFPTAPSGNSLARILKPMVAFVRDLQVLLTGYETNCMLNGFGQNVDVTNFRSWVRLSNPNYKKYGGGSRIKSVEMKDEWNNMVGGEANRSYTQEFNYQTNSNSAGTTGLISSGVASWEPSLGGEENLHRNPLHYKEEILLAPDNEYYTEKPVGDGLFPSPNVGYSQVKVRNKTARSDLSSNGFSIHKFYTAKDFPTISKMSIPNIAKSKSGLVRSIFKIKSYQDYAVSQGFVIEVNNMHGKEKATEQYNEAETLVSYKRYEYLTETSDKGSISLSNSVKTLDQEGKESVSTMGLRCDIWQEFQQTSSEVESKGFSFNTEGIPFIFGLFPIPIAIPMPHNDKSHLKTATTTKLISRNGMLSKVIQMQDGATAVSENLYYDKITGQTLITKTQNEFGGNKYNTVYPAHWMYKGMGPAYESIGLEYTPVYLMSDGKINTSGGRNYKLNAGDEVIVGSAVTFLGHLFQYFKYQNKFHVSEKNGSLYLVYPNGQILKTWLGLPLHIKVLRPAKRNMSTLPIYSYTSSSNPVVAGSISLDPAIKVLQASGSEFKEEWSVNPLTKNKVVCTDTTVTGKTDLFFKDTFMIALMKTDSFWHVTEDQQISVYRIAKSIFSGVNPNRIWLNKPINELFYWRISAPISFDTARYDYYQAAINNDNSFYLFNWDCESPHPPVYDAMCLPFYINRIDTSSLPGCPHTLSYLRLKDTIDPCFLTAHVRSQICITTPGCVDFAEGDTINPYTFGTKGNWRPYRDYIYHTSRFTTYTASLNTLPDRDGYYKNYNHLFQFTNTNPRVLTFNGSSTTEWVTNNTNILHDKRGNQIESENAIAIPSAALYGYRSNKMTALAENARVHNIAYDGMEEWNFNNLCDDDANCYLDEHLDFYDATSIQDNSKAHSGRFSLRLDGADTLGISRLYKTYQVNGLIHQTNSTPEYILGPSGVLPKFIPDSGDYVASLWIKPSSSSSSGKLQIRINDCPPGSGTIIDFTPKGPVIEGWQRVFGTFHIAGSLPCGGGSDQRSVEIDLISSGDAVYFDDFRIHPRDANMKTYVYDHRKERLAASLDENNYATFYEYDDAGNLIRVKKETERGILTISENRQYLKSEK
jgi:hypothetical protein